MRDVDVKEERARLDETDDSMKAARGASKCVMATIFTEGGGGEGGRGRFAEYELRS